MPAQLSECRCVFSHLQVPLVIFKREKEVARKLEFDGLYITEQPSEDDIKGQWDRLVINTQWVRDYERQFWAQEFQDVKRDFPARVSEDLLKV